MNWNDADSDNETALRLPRDQVGRSVRADAGSSNLVIIQPNPLFVQAARERLDGLLPEAGLGYRSICAVNEG